MTAPTRRPRAEDLPYRPCVGTMVLDRRGLVWIGRRVPEENPEYDGSPLLWQMPQGGIDEGEDPLGAAHRELFEETGMRSVVPDRRSARLDYLRSSAGVSASASRAGSAVSDRAGSHSASRARRSRHRQPRRRRDAGVRRVALGADGAAGAHRAVQAPGLRSGVRSLPPLRRPLTPPSSRGAQRRGDPGAGRLASSHARPLGCFASLAMTGGGFSEGGAPSTAASRTRRCAGRWRRGRGRRGPSPRSPARPAALPAAPR